MLKYRLYPNKQQQRLLEQQQESLRLYDQQAELPTLKAARR